MPRKMIQVGTGGFGGAWCQQFLPPAIKDGLVEVVAAVDINPEALKNAEQFLGLEPSRCYTDIEQAFTAHRADFCTVVVPPPFHEQVVDAALAHDLHILSEKPIADTLAASVRIADKVARAGRKMAVTMSHRFDQDKHTLREELRLARHGQLDYLVCHHTCALRKSPTWGKFRYDIPDVQMIEGGVHYLDILADLAGAPCETLYAQTWNPPWSEFAGNAQALVNLRFGNGVRAIFEAAATNAVGLFPWGQEYWRAECEGATLILDHRKLEYFPYNPAQPGVKKAPGNGEPIALREQPRWGHGWLIEKFVHWLDGGTSMETNVEDNLQSVALFCAAIESSRTGAPVQVQELLRQAKREVSPVTQEQTPGEVRALR